MKSLTDQINSTNLVPFRKRRGPYHIPGMTGENERLALEVDHNLDPEEERFIRHYLGYADTLLQGNASELLEPQEEVSAPKISLVEDSASNAAPKDDALNNDQFSAGQFSNDQLDHENSTEAA